MITLLIIIGVIVLLIKSLSPDKKNYAEDEAMANSIPPFELVARPMSTFNKFVNMSFGGAHEVSYFSFNNHVVTIELKNGASLCGYLYNMTVKFDQSGPSPSEPLVVTVKVDGQKIKFYEMKGIYTSDEWELMFRVLSLASKTYGVDYFKSRKINIQVHRVKGIVNLINKLS